MGRHYHILHILADGNFHSGQLLGAELGLSRSAVWKAVQLLKSRGVEVYSVPGRGYRLASPVEFLERGKIFLAMDERSAQMVRQMDIFPEIDSTNDYLGQLVPQGIESGRVCLSEYQHHGRGRQGKVWIAPFGKSICLSLFWKFPAGPTALAGLSLVAGVALVRALSHLGIVGLKLKWPNDLYWRDRKLGGVLLEVSGEVSGPANVVIGVGLNMEISQEAGEGIGQPWTDLSAVTGGGSLSRNQVCGLLLQYLCGAMRQFSDLGLSPFLEEWRSHDVTLGRMVELLLPGHSVTGRAMGIDDRGALLLDMDGSVQRFVSGDVSLRVQA